MTTCPQCGYTEVVQAQKFSHVMSHYYEEGKDKNKTVIFNSGIDKITIPADEENNKPARTYIRVGSEKVEEVPANTKVPVNPALSQKPDTAPKVSSTIPANPAPSGGTGAPAVLTPVDAFGNPIPGTSATQP